MRLRQTTFLVLTFVAGFFLCRYYPADPGANLGQEGGLLPHTTPSALVVSAEDPNGTASRGGLRDRAAGDDPEARKGSLTGRVVGDSTGKKEVKVLHDEYSAARWQPEAADASDQDWGEGATSAEEVGNDDVVLVGPDTLMRGPSPEEASLDLQQALLDLGIAPEQARFAAEDLLNQMEAAPSVPQGAPEPPTAIELGGQSLK